MNKEGCNAQAKGLISVFIPRVAVWLKSRTAGRLQIKPTFTEWFTKHERKYMRCLLTVFQSIRVLH